MPVRIKSVQSLVTLVPLFDFFMELANLRRLTIRSWTLSLLLLLFISVLSCLIVAKWGVAIPFLGAAFLVDVDERPYVLLALHTVHLRGVLAHIGAHHQRLLQLRCRA